MQTVLALTAIALLAGCRAAAPTAEPVLGMPAEMPRYDFKLSLGYDKNDDVVLNWISERPARPECGEPLSMQCDFTIVIEENGPLPTSVSISQSHGIDGHKEGDGVRITSEAIVDGEVHRDEQVAGNPDNIVWTARCRIEMGELDFDQANSTASGSVKLSLAPDQPGWHVKHTLLILRTSGGEEVQVDLFG
jgi:hypothetical protein